MKKNALTTAVILLIFLVFVSLFIFLSKPMTTDNKTSGFTKSIDARFSCNVDTDCVSTPTLNDDGCVIEYGCGPNPMNKKYFEELENTLKNNPNICKGVNYMDDTCMPNTQEKVFCKNNTCSSKYCYNRSSDGKEECYLCKGNRCKPN